MSADANIDAHPPARSIGWFLRSLLPLVARYRRPSLLLLMLLLVDVGFEAMVPLAFRSLIDDAIAPQNFNLLITILALLGGAGALVAVSQVGRDWLYAYLGSRVLNDLRHRMYIHLQSQSLSFYSRTGSADILARFSTDLAAVENAVVLALPAGILCACGLVLSAVILAFLEWRLALLAFLGLPLCLIGPRLIGPHAAREGYRLKDRQAALAAMVQETVNAQPVIKAFGLHSVLFPRFHSSADELCKVSLHSNFLAYLMERTPNIGVLAFNLVVIGVGGWLAFRGLLSVGSLVSFQAIFLSLSHYVEWLTRVIPNLVQAAAGMQRIEELLAAHPQVVDPPAAPALPRLQHAVRFEHVTFSYADRPILRDVTLEIPAGSFVAFVGASGSGKSTVLNLLMRFYDPDRGAVRFDGRDVRVVTQDSLRAQIGVVFQESFLFDTSVRENIRMADPAASDAAVERASTLAGLHETVAAMPAGYDTRVGERGAQLSGGQRQRVAIARALLREPALLVLDEATSALDPATEASINASINHLRGGRTIVSVTHRLASITGADRIFVLRDGQLAEAGTHAELLARGGDYCDLWEKQSGFAFDADGDGVSISTGRLRRLPILSGLDDAMLADLAQYFATEIYAAGREVIRDGDPGDRFYLVARGRVEVIKHDDAGKPLPVAMLSDGDHFGEIALLRDSPRNATVRTLTSATLLSLSRAQFSRLIARQPEIRQKLIATLELRS
jgi:ATP-binding cassette subfamily B protein